MTPTQHEKIDRLFHAALAVAPDQRDIWLAQACEGDDELHREVKSLLALSEEAETFIKVPLFNDAREASAERQDQTITRKTKYCPQCQRQYQATERLCPQDGSFLSLQDPYKLVGRTLADKYRLDALVGMGGMGAVYYCYHTGINRRVAFKILLPHLALQSERVLEMFETEAKTSGQLSHENIADVKDAGRTSEGIAYLVMEWLDGRTLEQEIADSGPLQLGRIVNILRQIAAALDTAHAQRIIHRDLKPSNVMLIKRANGSDHVKVLDFGIAKILDNTAGTTVSQVMGTPHYASPEQLEPGKRINTSSDIYSLGVMLYQMLTRKLPFDAPAIRELIQMQLSAPSPSVREQRPDAPAPVEQLVHRMLAKDPDHRPARAGEVARLFESAVRASAGLQAERAEVAVSDAPIVTMRQNAHPTAKGRAAISEPTASPPTDALKARPEKVGVFKLVGAMLTALVIAATGIYFCLNRQPVLTEKNTILLTDFENKTGDPVFDGVLEHGLAVQLEQSPFMKIFSEDRVRETLRYMGRSPDEDVTPVIGREICQRQGIKAMLTGSIASLGRNYVIGLEAVNGQSGEKLALEQGEADGKEQVLRTLGQMAARLREKLGEAISSVQKFNAPFYMATTPSFEAFKSYSIGRQQQNKDKNPQAISAYKRAIELDPNFARAYSALSLLYFIGGERELAAEFATKAFELRERTSEFEKMDISIRYYQYVTGEIDRVIEVAEQLKQSYQNDFAPHNVLSTTYNRIGQFEKACEEAREALRLDPTFAPGYASLADSLINLSRFEEAKEVIQRAIAQHCDRPILHQFLYDIAFIQGDTSAMQKQIDWAVGEQQEHRMVFRQAQAAAFRGQLGKDRELSKQAIALAQRNKAKELAAVWTAQAVLKAALLDNRQQISGGVKNALAIARSDSASYYSALALALCGEIRQAQILIDEVVSQNPKDTILNAGWGPTIRAAIEINRRNPTQALQLLQAISPYESATHFWPIYIRGHAYLLQQKGAEAAADFQKIIDHRGWDPISPLYPLAHLGLGRAAAISGDLVKARKAYEDFFALWKDADADLPILLAAKQEYSKLR